MAAPGVPGLQLSNPVHLLSFGFGAGLSPKAPGTVGTLVGVILYLPLAGLPLLPYLGVVMLICLVGVYLCGATARDLGVHDHPGIVWDEIAGFLLTMVAVPFGLGWVIAGFVLFRLFDIWKPWPISWLDRNLGGGLGIMVDDLVAGLFAAACLHGWRLVMGG